MKTFAPFRGAGTAPVAWDATGTSESYDALCARAQGVAAHLREQRVDAEGVLLLCEDRYWFAVGLLGAWEAGVRVGLPPHRGAAALDELSRRHFVLHDGAAHAERSVDLRQLSAQLSAQLSTQRAEPLAEIPGERPLLTLYTSGSRGQPQAWHKCARQLLGEAQVLVEALGVRPSERLLPTVAPQHIYGLLFGVLVPLQAGASFFRATPLHGETIVSAAIAGKADVVISVPAHLGVVARALEGRGGSRWGAVRTIVSSGAPLPDELGRELRRVQVEVYDVLGSTETGGIALRRAGLDSAWTPLPSVSVRVGDDERLWVTSPFLEDPNVAYATGDRGQVDAEGRFTHLGRADDVVKVGGKRVSLGEVESAALALPGVHEAAALRVEVGGLRGEEVWLAVVASELAPSAVRTGLQGRLDPVFVPRRIRVVTALPREANGKLRRDRLRALFLTDQAPEVPGVRLCSYAPSESHCAAVLEVLPDSPRFVGHFPEAPLFPGVAQLADLVLPLVERCWPDLGSLERIQRLQFVAPVRPGERVTVALERSLAKVAFELRSPREPLARGSLWFHSPNPSDVRQAP